MLKINFLSIDIIFEYIWFTHQFHMNLTSLIAGVFGGFLGNMLVNYFVKNLDFKYDYKKYILEKRKKAYDEVEEILAQLSTRVAQSTTGKYVSELFSSKENLIGFDLGLENTIVKNKVWLSNYMVKMLSKISYQFREIVRDNPHLATMDELQLSEISKTWRDVLQPLPHDLYKLFFKDIKELDHITEFKNKEIY